MKKHTALFIFVSICFIAISGSAFCSTIISEDFNDKNYSSPLLFYNVTGYDQNLVWDSGNAVGSSGYCLKFDHSQGYLAGIGVLSGFSQHVDEGVYIRYWVKYDSNYQFPAERDKFENLKMFKLAGDIGWDIEFIYKDTANGGPSYLQLFWNKQSNSSVLSNTTRPLNQTIQKGVWHKIEIFIKIAPTSAVHVQVNDKDIYNSTNADIRLQASAYSSSQQFISVLASSAGRPPAGRGYWHVDNVTIAKGEGDRCNNEPPEPGGTPSFMPNPPTGLTVVD
jgi:hypothetical protein